MVMGVHCSPKHAAAYLLVSSTIRSRTVEVKKQEEDILDAGDCNSRTALSCARSDANGMLVHGLLDGFRAER